ncbi:MAG: DUF2140 family protein [Alicyclobacillus sp.]|nr:DUF2140 family protein [Alicyclobacillus sp.]
MWKKAFVVLLSLNLFVVVGGALWWGTLPKASSVQPPQAAVMSNDKPATIQLSVGQDAINSYLEYALSEQADVSQVVSYANVQFADTWTVQIGLKLKDRVIPCNIVFTPTVANGNLILHVESATTGDLPVPLGALFFVMSHLPWPAWIAVDGANHDLHLNFTERPQQPYGVRILGYSAATREVSLQVSILPKSLLSTTHS